MQSRFLNQRGFSLVELMAILVILSLGTALALPRFSQSLRKDTFKKDTHEVMARLRGFKLQAVSSGKGVTIAYADQNFIVTVQGEEPILAPLSIHEGGRLELQPEELYFSPQGWARPATLILQRENLSQTILLDPLTGRPYRAARKGGTAG